MASFSPFWGRLSFIVQPVHRPSMLYVLSQLENMLPVPTSLLSVFPSYPTRFFFPDVQWSVARCIWAQSCHIQVHISVLQLVEDPTYLLDETASTATREAQQTASCRPAHGCASSVQVLCHPAGSCCCCLEDMWAERWQISWYLCFLIPVFSMYDGRSLGGSTASLRRCVVVAG